ncbi:MAG: hypothetical protein M4D80_36665 [Myxococcota bacterium]|nr:hypothetical protein [Myxococcota bacterium]
MSLLGGFVIGIDARSERGVLIVNNDDALSYYCVDVLPGGLIVVDMFRSIQ